MKSNKYPLAVGERVVTRPYPGERRLYGVIQAPGRAPRTWIVVFDSLGTQTVMHESEIEIEQA